MGLPQFSVEKALEGEVETEGQDPGDRLIRTRGEMRVSNFLLYQIAYAEFVFVDECWPDFTPEVFAEALKTYARRDRRFGKV